MICIWGTVYQVTLNGLLRTQELTTLPVYRMLLVTVNKLLTETAWLEPIMSNKNKDHSWALWTEMNVKCTNVAESQHDWTKIFNGQNNQKCSFWKLIFQQLSPVWCDLKAIFFSPQKVNQSRWSLFSLRSTWVVGRTVQSTKEQWTCLSIFHRDPGLLIIPFVFHCPYNK